MRSSQIAGSSEAFEEKQGHDGAVEKIFVATLRFQGHQIINGAVRVQIQVDAGRRRVLLRFEQRPPPLEETIGSTLLGEHADADPGQDAHAGADEHVEDAALEAMVGRRLVPAFGAAKGHSSALHTAQWRYQPAQIKKSSSL